MAFQSAGVHITRDNSPRVAIDHDQIQKFVAREKLYRTRFDLAHECLIGAKQELLAGLSPRIERPGNLDPAERSVAQIPAVCPCKGDSLCDRLVDQVGTALRKPVNVCFPSPKIPPLIVS